MERFDYVIVGAGAAGCVLANRLSEDPDVSVALIEAGPDRNARKAILRIPLAMVTFMAPALAFLGGPKFMSWFQTEPEPGLQGRSIALPRGKGTGGSTNINGQIFIRGQREDFDGWRDAGNPGWGYDDLLPYFKKLERFEALADPQSGRVEFGGKPLAEQVDPQFHGTSGPLNIAPLRSVNPLADIYLDAAQRAGFPLNPDFNGEQAKRRRPLYLHPAQWRARHRRRRLSRSGAPSAKSDGSERPRRHPHPDGWQARHRRRLAQRQ